MLTTVSADAGKCPQHVLLGKGLDLTFPCSLKSLLQRNLQNPTGVALRRCSMSKFHGLFITWVHKWYLSCGLTHTGLIAGQPVVAAHRGPIADGTLIKLVVYRINYNEATPYNIV